MSFEVLDHTADVSIEVRAPTLAALFEEAAIGFVSVITEPGELEEGESRRVEVEAPDRERLMVRWLDELLFLFETESVLPGRVETQLEETSRGLGLSAEVRVCNFYKGRHPEKVQIKAVTYHGLVVEEDDGGWRAVVVFDI